MEEDSGKKRWKEKRMEERNEWRRNQTLKEVNKKRKKDEKENIEWKRKIISEEKNHAKKKELKSNHTKEKKWTNKRTNKNLEQKYYLYFS